MDYNLIKVTDETVISDAGICYFDPVEETIKEIGSGYMMGTNPYSPVIHKLLFVAKNNSVKYLKIKIKTNRDIERMFDIKILPGAVAPALSDFDNTDNYNELIVTESIQSYSFVPFFVYIKAKVPVDKISSLPLEINYE